LFPPIFIAQAAPFKIVLQTALGITLQTVDRIPAGEAIDLETLEQVVLEVEGIRDEAITARDVTLVARDDALAAAEASGDVEFFDTKADATAALGGLSEDQIVEVLVDESLSDARTRYRVETGALVFKVYAGLPRPTDAEARAGTSSDRMMTPVATTQAFSEFSALYEPLDIWPAFSGAASGGTWDATTYGAWIAGINANLAAEISAGTIVKTDRGLCSDGVNTIWSYAAGSGKLKVLLNAGIHGAEKFGQFAAMRWFEQFVKSDHPTMVMLRRMLRVTWVPTASPSAYVAGTRVNSNGVDPNRQFEYYWDRYVSNPAFDPKGAAVLSEPEAILMKALVDEGNILVIDCHDLGSTSTTPTMRANPPDCWHLGKRGLIYTASKLWQQAYGATWTELNAQGVSQPSLCSWSSFYNTIVNGVSNAASVTVETSSLMGGSTHYTNITQTGAKNYNGYITHIILTWLSEGQRPPEPYSAVWSAVRATDAPSTSITSGGTLIDTAAGVFTAFKFDGLSPVLVGATQQDYLDAIPLGPGAFILSTDGYIEGDASGETRIDIGFYRDGVAIASALSSITTPANASRRQAFSLRRRVFIDPSWLDGETIPRFDVRFSKADGSHPSAKVKRAGFTVEWVPNSLINSVPLVN
jgi:hypothetical protein